MWMVQVMKRMIVSTRRSKHIHSKVQVVREWIGRWTDLRRQLILVSWRKRISRSLSKSVDSVL
jgi:hypothetical protein